MEKRVINNIKNTRRALNDMLDNMINHLNDNPDVINILDLTTYFKITNKWFSNIQRLIDDRTWKNEILDKIDIVYDMVEHRRLKKGETSKNPAWDIFILKAYHKKVEEQHIKTDSKIDNTGELNIKINYPE